MSTALMRNDFGARPRFPAERGGAIAAWTLPVPRDGAGVARERDAGAFAAGLGSATFRRLLPAAIVGLARQAGLDGIAWDGDAHAPCGAPATPDPEASLGVIGMVARASGLDCVAYTVDIAPDDADRFAAALAAAEKLGARGLRLRPATRGRAIEDHGAAEHRRTAAALRRMADLAMRRGRTLTLDMPLANGGAAARDLIEAIDHPNLDLSWRPRPGLTLEAALAEIAVVGRFVRDVRVGAADERGRRLPLAARANWWGTVLDAFRAERPRAERWAFLDGVRDDDTRAFAEDARCLVDLLGRR
jgi:hypothetical protein